MKFGFVTCVQLGLDCMDEIYRVGGSLDLVVTLKDTVDPNKSGRVFVDAFCDQHGIDLIKIRSVNAKKVAQAIRDYELDWLFIIGWSQIAKPHILDAPKYGVLGIHPTLLPTGRGRAPIPWAIIKGLPETGVTLFKLDAGVDTGPIVYQERLPLSADETATTLYERVCVAHRTLIANVWPDLAANTVTLQTQDETQATVWEKRTPADGEIRPTMTCQAVDRLVRGVTHPYPGTFIVDEAQRYCVWAGVPHVGASSAEAQPIHIKQSSLFISLADGVYEATDWEPNVLP